MIDVKTIREMIKEEATAQFDVGTVIAADVRGDRVVGVRLSGTGVTTRAMTCVEGLQAGDRVLVVHIKRLDRMVAVAQILDEHEGGLSRHGQLSPPNNLTYTPIPAGVEVRWDTWPGEDLSWQVRYNSSASDTGATDVLITRGSHYLHWTVDASGDMDTAATAYFRVRAVRWLSDSNIMFSAWSAWSAAQTSGGHSLRELIEVEFENATELTISEFIGLGQVTRTQVYHTIDTEGNAATDNLDTINGGTEGDLLIIRPADGARTVVVKHNTGNIWLLSAADITLDDANDHLMLIYDGSMWCDASGGGGGGGHTTFIAHTDTPAAYGGAANHLVGVDATENWLQWIGVAGWLAISDISDLAWQPDAVAVLHMGRVYEYADPDDAFTNAVGGDTILVPRGTWTLSSGHTLAANVSVKGMTGPPGTCILQGAISGTLLTLPAGTGEAADLTILNSTEYVGTVIGLALAAGTTAWRVVASATNTYTGGIGGAKGIAVTDATAILCFGYGYFYGTAVGAIGIEVKNASRVERCYGFGYAGHTDGTAIGIRMAGGAWCWGHCIAEGDGAIGADQYGMYIVSGTNTAAHGYLDGDTADLYVNTGATLEVYALKYNESAGAGTITQFSGDRAGTALAETITGIWTFDEEIILKKQPGVPAVASGYAKLYAKSDGDSTKLYMLEDDDSVGSGVRQVAGMADGVDATVGAGKDFATIQGAIDFFKNWVVTGDCTITVDADAYDETLEFASIVVGAGATLTLVGDTRDLAGMSFFDGCMSNRENVDDDKAGTLDGVISLVGNDGQPVITVTNAGAKNPDFDADGWGSGDKILVYEWAAGPVWTATEYTIDSVLNNAITLTANLTNGGVSTAGTGDDGAGITLLPNRRLEPTTNPTVILSDGVKGVGVDGFYVEPNTTSIRGIHAQSGASITVENVVVRKGYFGLQSERPASLLTATKCCAMWECLIGAAAASLGGTLPDYVYVIEAVYYGFWIERLASGTVSKAVAITCADGYRCERQSYLYAWECTARHNTVGYRAESHGFNEARQTADQNNNNGTDYVPAPAGAGQYAEDASNFGILFYSN